MEFRLYACPKCEKVVKSTSGLTRYVNACKIPISLPYCQPSNPEPVLDYNMTNSLNLPSDNNEKNIRLVASDNDKERIRLADIDNDKENIRPADIDEQRPAISNWTIQNGLLSKSSSTFREVMFDKSKFLASTPVSNTRYEHPGSQNNNPFYLFNNQLDYALAHYFAKSETTKRNMDKFLSNPLIKLIIKNLLYCNIDE